MPRNRRHTLAGVPLHLLQRGNDRVPCFRCDGDLVLYMGLLGELAGQYGCEIHAYVLMTNHVHILASSRDTIGPSRLMKNLSQRYAQHFNKANRRTGTLWEGRFRSHIVDSEAYLFACQRYIELNPVRARMVTAPWEYPWSSYRANAGLEKSLLLRPHRYYFGLGTTDEERHRHYRQLFANAPCPSELAWIRHCINTGSTLGTEAFRRGLEDVLGRPPMALPRGRPKSREVLPDGKRKLTPV